MEAWLSVISSLCVSGATLGCVYLSIAIFAVRSFPRRGDPSGAPIVPISVLKPLHGAEAGLFARLSAYFNQTYEGAVELVCGVRDGRDAAMEEVRLVERDKPIQIVVNDEEHGPNRKVSNLVNMLPSARNEVLIVSDSDIEVGPEYLSKIVAHLHAENVGAVTCLYHGVPAAGVWSRHAALAINSHFLPSIIVAVAFDLAEPCCGSTIAIHRRILQGIGGFQRFAGHLADDYEIGRAVRNAGYRVAIPSFTVGHHCFSDSLASLLAQELRAARTVKCLDPFGYAGAFITHPFPLALASAAIDGGCALPIAAVALGLRALLCFAVERSFGAPRQPYALLPLREMLSFLVFCLSFWNGGVEWRGVRFDVTRAGALKPRECPPAPEGAGS